MIEPLAVRYSGYSERGSTVRYTVYGAGNTGAHIVHGCKKHTSEVYPKILKRLGIDLIRTVPGSKQERGSIQCR